MTEANVQGVPNLVVEILSKSAGKRDRTIKQQLYERSGVDEYWIVDPVASAISVMRLEDGRFGTAIALRAEADDSLTTPLLPGFTVKLTEIFSVPSYDSR